MLIVVGVERGIVTSFGDDEDGQQLYGLVEEPLSTTFPVQGSSATSFFRSDVGLVVVLTTHVS